MHFKERKQNTFVGNLQHLRQASWLTAYGYDVHDPGSNGLQGGEGMTNEQAADILNISINEVVNGFDTRSYTDTALQIAASKALRAK